MPDPVLSTWKQVRRNVVPDLQTITTQDNLGFKNRELWEYRRGCPLLSLGRPERPLRMETFELSLTSPVLARRQERRVSWERQCTYSATVPVGLVSSEPWRGLSGWTSRTVGGRVRLRLERESSSLDSCVRAWGSTLEAISSGEWGGQTCILVKPTPVP